MDKVNYRSLFNRCIFQDRNGILSTDFIELAKKQCNLTFNTNYLNYANYRPNIETPFLEIERYDNFLTYKNDDFCYELGFEKNYELIIQKLMRTLRTTLRNLDKNEKYLFSHSAGSDSRIISGTMAMLRDTEGYNFDNVIFHCWGKSEKESFLKIMKRLKWENISIIDDSNNDHFDIGTSELSVDGWYEYINQIKFWGNINPSEYILISGAEGEAFTRSFQDWKHSYGFFADRGEAVHRLAKIFKDIYLPYLAKPMLNALMSVPMQFKGLKDARLGRDKMRTDIVNSLCLADIEIPKSYYVLNISEDRKRYMVDCYNNCQFKRDYGVKLDTDDLFKNSSGFNSKLWAFAVTVYDKIFK